MSKSLVAKFGGTSIKNAECIRRVLKIVQSLKDIKVVVVSAIGGVTDLLFSYSYASVVKRDDFIRKIQEIHIKISEDLNLDRQSFIEKDLYRLYKYKNVKRLTPREIDDIVSLGEDLSSLIVAEFFCMNNFPVSFFDIRKLLRTDNAYGKASPILREIKNNIHLLPPGIVITQGFIGADLQNHTTTLGRGGSDYSAALIAEALGSVELLIYTDVNGVYSIDPCIDKRAKLIPEINFREMKDMASFGAKILHLSTLEPCFRSKIVVKILSTFNPCSPHTEVTFKNDVLERNGEILAVTLRPNQTLVNLKNSHCSSVFNILDEVFSVLSGHEIIIDLLTSNECGISFIVNENNSGTACSIPFVFNKDLICELEDFAAISLEAELTLITVIGRNMTAKSILQRILDHLNNIVLHLVYYESDSSSLGILVHATEAERIAKILHQQLIINNLK